MLQFIETEAEKLLRESIFKNISCYSLSNPQEIKSAGKWKFKNISCYSLSVCCVGCGLKKHNLKTSHVTVYQRKEELNRGL